MSVVPDVKDTTKDSQPTEPAQAPEGQPPRPLAPPIESRFLFVDVAALRAKQLRRGALPKLSQFRPEPGKNELAHKPERIAMEEVRAGLIPYELPNTKGEEAA